MKGNPMHTEMVNDVAIKLFHMNTRCKTPYAYQDGAKAKLDKLVELGILEEVHDASEWVSPMSFLQKPDGDICLVVDLVHL